MKLIKKQYLFSDRQSFARTCAEVSESRRESGIYVISPDSERVPPFSVFCNFSGERAGIIIIETQITHFSSPGHFLEN